METPDPLCAGLREQILERIDITYDNATSRALASSLPVTVQRSDMLDRELYGGPPEPLPTAEGDRQTDYRAGQLVYWPPGPGLAVYYEHAGPSVPGPGMVVLGTIDSGTDAFTGHDGSAEFTIGRAD
ncbi:cyclophilin-like fold protein [Streptomyces sp. NPDC091271]|uniref:cyclophilin-like fold protein n=1 Tax=Streptomyces sp. NPDC091271 TaxID=3365980 RepID=UPI0037FADD18